MPQETLSSKQSFSKILLKWYEYNKRDLPWRSAHTTAYQIVVSEIMLQQTQVERVKLKWEEFLALFPTIEDLAKASPAQVIASWSGLGYNRRALNLHKFAQQVVSKYNGVIPKDPQILKTLAGIGPYASGSIASFAYNLPVPAIDVNVRRVMMRFFEGTDQGRPMSNVAERQLYELVNEQIPRNQSREFHNALMDFASKVCSRKKPDCSSCPLQAHCAFFPLYEELGENALQQRIKKHEKGRLENGKHIPNRIFRGRIVEYVRNNCGKTVKLWALGEAIKEDYNTHSTTENNWLLSLCEKLATEGMINFEKDEKNVTLSLPKSMSSS